MNLSHHNDGKQKFNSHEVGLIDKDFHNAEYGIFSHNFMDLAGYGETKEEALEDFKRKFQYLLDEWNAFGKMLFESDVLENKIVEVDCFGKPI